MNATNNQELHQNTIKYYQSLAAFFEDHTIPNIPEESIELRSFTEKLPNKPRRTFL